MVAKRFRPLDSVYVSTSIISISLCLFYVSPM